MSADFGPAPVLSQFRLAFGPPVQRLIWGGWEPVADAVPVAAPAEPEAPAPDPRQTEIGAPRQLRLRALRSRPKAGLESTTDNVAGAPPLGDTEAAPIKARVAIRRGKAEAGRTVAMVEGWSETREALLRSSSELAACGTRPVPGGGKVTVREHEGRRHVCGLIPCGRMLCPVCGPFAGDRRREALAAVAPELAPQGRHFTGALTLRHRMGVAWVQLAHAERTIWRRQQQRREWREAVIGFVRQDECTYGDNGFHQHIQFLITLRADVDPEAFQVWLAEFWQREARKLGRTCDWKEGWWSEVAPAEVARVVQYVAKDGTGDTPAPTLGHVVAAEVLGGDAKRGSALWDLPPVPFAEVWIDSKRHRWFATGGVWADALKAEKVEEDDDAMAVREEKGECIAAAPGAAWKALPRELRDWIVGLLYNPAVSRERFLSQWRWLWIGRGCTEADLALPAQVPADADTG